MDSIDELRKKEMEYKRVKDLAKKQPAIECSYCGNAAVIREDWGEEVRFACEDCSTPGVGVRIGSEKGGGDGRSNNP